MQCCTHPAASPTRPCCAHAGPPLQEKGLAPKDVYFVDVGGNIGTFSLSVAAHGFSVLTFEAMFANAQTIRHSICANPGMEERVTLVNKV